MKNIIIFFIKLSYLLMLIILFIILKDDIFLEFNFLERFFGNPFIIIFNLIEGYSIGFAFIIVLIISSSIFIPIISSNFAKTKNFLCVFPKILEIHKDEGKDSQEKLNLIIDTMEEKNASLFSPIIYLFYLTIYGFSTSMVFGKMKEYESITFLWFDIKNYDKFYILPILVLIIVAFSILKSYKNFTLKKGKINFIINIFFLVIKVGIVIRCFFSSMLCVCTIVIVSTTSLIHFIKKKRKEKKYGICITTKIENSK